MSDTLLIPGKHTDLGGFSVNRVLPVARKRALGPFVFLDHMGPADFPAGRGMDVRPHPHIGLATLTYLFSGAIRHRDSLGVVQDIEPGAVNWMTAGRGIVHSERSRPEDRVRGQRLDGIQTWIALPRAELEREPSFEHYPAEQIPRWHSAGAQITLVAGAWEDRRSPVHTLSPLTYLDIAAQSRASFSGRVPDQELGIYVAHGSVIEKNSQTTVPTGSLLCVGLGVGFALDLAAGARVIVLGGQPFAEPRIIWWNFVGLDPARIELAKSDWRNGKFPAVPGEHEFIPLPEH